MYSTMVSYRAPADLSETCPLPLFDALRLAVAAMGVASATPASAPTLPTLLSASPSPAQRALAEVCGIGRTLLSWARSPLRRSELVCARPLGRMRGIGCAACL